MPRAIARVKPRTHYYHYSHPESQGALITQTLGFPEQYEPSTHDFHCAYADRIQSWDSARFDNACKLAGTGEQGWAYKLPSMSDEQLREFAKVALNLPAMPEHVRIVHYFNVASGYSCPTVEAITASEAAVTN